MLLSAGAVGADVAAEPAAGDVDGSAVVLRERPDGGAAQIGARRIAPVVRERRVDDSSCPPRSKIAPPPPPSTCWPVELPSVNAMFWITSLGRRLVVAVRRRPHLRRVARVLVEDPAPAGAAERHQAAAVQHDPGARIAHLGGRAHGDRDRMGPAGEADDAARPNRGDDCGRGAAGRRAAADDVVRMGRVHQPARGGDRYGMGTPRAAAAGAARHSPRPPCGARTPSCITRAAAHHGKGTRRAVAECGHADEGLWPPIGPRQRI